jgi:phosphoribosylformimino-5-aminoimidazole carboxamide ribotide isomerase
MIVYPAIDLVDGQVVRLAQGDYARQTEYELDPVELAEKYRDQGATWLHIVDLDAARSGMAQNRGVIASLTTISGLQLQVGGGVRGEGDLESLLETGVARVVIGSAAIREPARVERWLSKWGAERVCVALDARADAAGVWWMPVAGWTEDSGVRLESLLERYVGNGVLKHVLCTDIARDGMLDGPNLELYRTLAAANPSLAIQAWGGVRDAADVVALRAAGAAGVVVGKALLDGRVTLPELLAC